jgi:hypothetical protein
MKFFLIGILMAATTASVFAQTGGINRPGGTGNTGGTGMGGAANTGATGVTGSGTGQAGSSFNFDPRFGAATFANPFGATGGAANANRLGGMGMGGMGMGGMGMGMGGFGMGGFGLGMGMGGRMGGMGMQQQQQSRLRPTVRLGFEISRAPTQQRSQRAQATLSRLPQSERFAGTDVRIDGERAIVTGSVRNAADAGLLKQLLLLEPGIFEVDVTELVAVQDRPMPGSPTPVERLPIPPQIDPRDDVVPAPQN